MVKRGESVIVKKLAPDATDESMSEVFVKSRKLHKVGIVDSPIHSKFNKHWLVKHDTSCLVRGISIGYYGIYREDELEHYERPVQEEDDKFTLNDPYMAFYDKHSTLR